MEREVGGKLMEISYTWKNEIMQNAEPSNYTTHLKNLELQAAPNHQ